MPRTDDLRGLRTDGKAINPYNGLRDDGTQRVAQDGGACLGHETLQVSTATGFASVPAGASRAVVTTESADIRFWLDGTSPTATEGHLIYAGSVFELDNAAQLAGFKAIALSGNATLQVSYY